MKSFYIVFFLIDRSNPKGSDRYTCERNQYYFSFFEVLLEIDHERNLQLAREMTFNLKERFGIFVEKEKFHPRWDSNPQRLN